MFTHTIDYLCLVWDHTTLSVPGLVCLDPIFGLGI